MKNSNGNWGCMFGALLVAGVLAFVMFQLNIRPFKDSPLATNASSSPSVPSTSKIHIRTSETYYDKVSSAITVGKSAIPEAQQNGWAESEMLEMEPSRSALQHIIAEQEPDTEIWVSSTEELIQDLVTATGKKFINKDDSSRRVIFPPQPLVFLVRKSKKSELDSYLHKENPLVSLPEDKFRYSCADILDSGGGDTAARYLKWAFQKTNGKYPSFKDFLKDLKKRGFQKRLNKDSGPLASDFAIDTTLDFILVHNALADRECLRSGSQVYKVIPTTTVFETPSAVILQEGIDRHGDTIKRFLQYLKQKIQLPSMEGISAIEDMGDVNLEKRQWEEIFNDGKRLSNSKS